MGIAPDARRRRCDRIELAVAYGLILLAVWTPLPWQKLVSLTALGWVSLATWAGFDGWRKMGLGGTGFRRSLWVAGAALLLAGGAATVAVRVQTLHAPPTFGLLVQRYWGYAIWSLLQEFLLLVFFLLRLERLLRGRRAAALVATALFAIAHLPNPILTVLTVLWGWAACWVFLHYRNLYTLAMAHATLGICIAVTVPGPVDHNMRVGLGYLTYREHKHAQRSQKDQTVSTQAWVMAAAPTRLSWRHARP
jgi:hypothetical protein